MIDGIDDPEGQHTAEIDNGIQRQLAQTVAGQHDAQHGSAEEEQVLRFGSQQPPENGDPALIQPHNGQCDQGNHQIGQQGKGNAGGNVGAEPGFPPQRQGMEGIARARVEQVTKEQLRHHSTVD